MPEKSNLELAADILIAAMQRPDCKIDDAGAALEFFQTMYQGICDFEEQQMHHRYCKKTIADLMQECSDSN